MGNRPTISERIAITITEASRHQRQFKRHHHKRAGKVWKASNEDMGTQMTAECILSPIGRKYLTQKQVAEKYEQRNERLEKGSAMARVGAGVRSQKRVKNTYSKEEMGTLSNYVGVCRWDNSYITKACYRRKMW